MGWTVYYEAKADSAITDKERKILAKHVAAWAPRLDEGSEAYAWEIKDDGKTLSGGTKIHYSKDDQGDFVTLVRAAQELEGLLPRFRFLISDDYVVTEEMAPSEVEPE